MSLDGQQIQWDRYVVIPRTLSFLIRNDQVLLQRIPETQGAWSGLLNGVGGHIEKGEDPYSSALREIAEETGMKPQGLKMCGTILIDSGDIPGIAIYVFVGSVKDELPRASREGSLEWVELEHLERYTLVEDLVLLIPRAIQSHRDREPFSALYSYDEQGKLTAQFKP